ncbi:MAG TPA: tetratricopeptide repeat protein [Chthoniobacterales bacterium]|nr:tetratricopeptide repeat protein [Chthoniobacterales bacterium]
MRFPVRWIRFACTLATVATFSSGLTAQAQQPAGGSEGGELAQLYASGMAAFQSGDYAKAAADLEALVNKAEFSPQLEPAYFSLGSAYFNAGNYPKAIAAFNNYQKKFPNGPHTAETVFGLAQANLQTKNYGEAANQFAALAKDSRFKDQALFFSATANKDAGKIDVAIADLEKLAGGELKSPLSVRGVMMLAQLYSQKGKADKVIPLINKLHERIGLVDNIVELNAMTVELGDQLYSKNFYADALECYRAAYPREQIIRLQNERLTAMQRTIDENLNTMKADPSQVGQLVIANNQLKADLARSRQLLEEFQKLPSITPAIYIRMARCFYEADKKWESIVVNQELVDKFPDAREREPALFGLIASLAEVNQAQKAQQRCEQYLKEFKTGPNADTVGYMMGVVSLQANDPQAAEGYFKRTLETQPQNKFAEQMRFLLGNAKFQAGKHDEAIAEYKKYLNDFPKGENVEEANYRLALTALFSGKYQDAMDQLHAYMKKYPNGQFVSDAKYRLAVCKYAASLYDEVIADCKAWEREYPKNQQLGEVLALLGDAYGAKDQTNEAIPIYINSYKTATTDEVMNYSLFAASKLLQKRGDWDKVADLFREFIELKPDSPTVISGLYWIGKAKAHEGKIDEAKRLTADTIKKYIADPNRDAVELLLTQLAQLCVKKKAPAATPETSPAPAASPVVAGVGDPGQSAPSFAKDLYVANVSRSPDGDVVTLASASDKNFKEVIVGNGPNEHGYGISNIEWSDRTGESKPTKLTISKDGQSAPLTGAAPASTTPATTSPGASPSSEAIADATPAPDPGAELDALLGSAEQDQNPTTRARVIYAKAELARLRRQPAEEEKNIGRIATEFKPDDLSPVLLGRAGDLLLAKQKLDDAAKFYQKLLEEFPKSDYADFGYAGLGEIAYQKKDLTAALRYFNDGTEKIAASQKLKDLTVGKAKTLFALDKLDEAKKGFEQVASVREWRGESTAFSVFSLGEIEAKRGRWAEANAYFQRVYVAYQKFLPWVAKAYLRSGESFEKLGKTQEAANTYRELLRNEKLSSFAEAAEARQRLQALGQG